MNPAATTLSAKEDEPKPEDEKGPAEDKPYRAYREGDKWVVYKLTEDGEPTGDPLGEYDSQEEAAAQIRALWANEDKQRGEGQGQGEEPVGDGGADVCVCPKCGAEAPHEKGEPCNQQECPECGAAMQGKSDEKDAKAPMKTEQDGQHPASHYLVVEDSEKPSTWHLRVRNVEGDVDHRLMGAAWAALHGGYRGNVYEGPGKREAIGKLTRLYASEDMDTPKAAEGPEVLVDGVRYVKEDAEPDRYLPEDAKVGRVLAARNARRLETALATLTEILKDAGMIEDIEEEEPEEKQDHDAPAAEKQAADDALADPEAGPEVPPTSERMALLRKLQLELLEVEK